MIVLALTWMNSIPRNSPLPRWRVTSSAKRAPCGSSSASFQRRSGGADTANSSYPNTRSMCQVAALATYGAFQLGLGHLGAALDVPLAGLVIELVLGAAARAPV